jgi:ABC-type sugar transport system ATPase subunit
VFRDVAFVYGPAAVLRSVSFKVPAGGSVAVVGATGAGKSSLVNLIPRLFDVTGGAVLVDGIDVRQHSLSVLRQAIGYVPQETFLFSMPLRTNVGFGHTHDLSEADLREAGDISQLNSDVAGFPDLRVEFATAPNDGDRFLPYVRDPETLAREWALPGTPGLEHRIGGLEKEDVTGNVSYDPDNHDRMVRLRAQKVAGIAGDIPELDVSDPDGADLLVLGWGGTYGSIAAAVRRVRRNGGKVAHAHLRYLNPFPRNTADVVRSYERVLVPEMNLGQLLRLVRSEFLVDAVGYNRVRGAPFRSSELADAIGSLL